MAEPIKNRRVNDLANAPTPQNTPATAASSFAGRVQPSVATIKEEDGIPGGLANNPALLSMIQGKLGTLVGRPSGYIDSLPKAVRDRVTGLKGVQGEHTKLEAQFQEELLALEKKYFAKYAPLYQRRAEIISGKVEPTEDELEAGRAAEEDEEDDEDAEDEEGGSKKKQVEDEDEDDEDAEPVKGIPEFWLTALKNLVAVAETITERDEEALAHLTDVRMRYLERPGFALDFEFSSNEFFSNKILTKTYYYQEETGYGGDFIYDHAEGDDITWKSAQQNLTVRIETRKQRNKHTGATRTVEKTIPAESFFSFFSPPAAPSGEDDEEAEEDIPEDLEERLEIDYQLGEEIKEKLIPRAVDWYTGEALEYEDLDDYDENEFEDEEFDEEEESDEDDDEEGEESEDKKKADPQECKQS